MLAHLRISYASSGVLFDHMATNPSLVYSFALWMHSTKHRRFPSDALRRTPLASTSWNPTHASNCVQKRDWYDMSRRISTPAPRKSKLIFESMRMNAASSGGVRVPCGMHEKSCAA